ncbi:MAG TPA: hypothetical protein VH518_25000 [Tepidisphaeraceae bacterium]|jgi:hypothetical protein
MTYLGLYRKLHDQPFKPFRIRMVNSTVYDIHESWMVVPGESSAVVVTQTRKDEQGAEIALDWKTVSISHMMEFSDLNAKSNGGRRKK